MPACTITKCDTHQVLFQLFIRKECITAMRPGANASDCLGPSAFMTAAASASTSFFKLDMPLQVIGKGHARTNKDAKKIACTGGLAHPLVRASQASLAGQGPGMLPPPMRAGSPSPDLHPAAQPGEPPQGRRSGSRATSPLGLLHADSQPRLVPQVCYTYL